MARKVNSSFQGINVLDVDPNALTRTRIFENSAGDTALVHDMMTGDNSPPRTLDASGDGYGCRLGIPIANQHCFSYRAYTNSAPGIEDDREVAVWSTVAKQPPGEITISCFLNILDGSVNPAFLWRFEAIEVSTGTTTASAIISPANFAVLTGLTPGTVYWYRVVAPSLHNQKDPVQINSVNLGFAHRQVNPYCLTIGGSDVSNSTNFSTSLVSDGYVFDFHDFDEDEFADGYLISGYHVTKLNQNQNALQEFLTGAPAGGNVTRKIIPGASQSAYYDHAAVGTQYANMANFAHIPIAGFGLGCIPLGGNGEDSKGGFKVATGCPDFRGPYIDYFWYIGGFTGHLPKYAANKMTVRAICYLRTSSPLSLGVACGVRVLDSTGTVVDTASKTAYTDWTRIGTSQFYVVEVTGIDHAPEEVNKVELGFWVVPLGTSTGGGDGFPGGGGSYTGTYTWSDGGDMRVVGYSISLEE